MKVVSGRSNQTMTDIPQQAPDTTLPPTSNNATSEWTAVYYIARATKAYERTGHTQEANRLHGWLIRLVPSGDDAERQAALDAITNDDLPKIGPRPNLFPTHNRIFAETQITEAINLLRKEDHTEAVLFALAYGELDRKRHLPNGVAASSSFSGSRDANGSSSRDIKQKVACSAVPQDRTE